MIYKGSPNIFFTLLKDNSSSDSGFLSCQNQWKVTVKKDEKANFCSPLHSWSLRDKPINVNVWQGGSLFYTHLKKNKVHPKDFAVLFKFLCITRQSDFPVTVYYTLTRAVWCKLQIPYSWCLSPVPCEQYVMRIAQLASAWKVWSIQEQLCYNIAGKYTWNTEFLKRYQSCIHPILNKIKKITQF